MAMLKPFPAGPVVCHEGCHTSGLQEPGGLLTYSAMAGEEVFLCRVPSQAFASIRAGPEDQIRTAYTV
jgi:hypothetical protein